MIRIGDTVQNIISVKWHKTGERGYISCHTMHQSFLKMEIATIYLTQNEKGKKGYTSCSYNAPVFSKTENSYHISYTE